MACGVGGTTSYLSAAVFGHDMGESRVILRCVCPDHAVVGNLCSRWVERSLIDASVVDLGGGALFGGSHRHFVSGDNLADI